MYVFNYQTKSLIVLKNPTITQVQNASGSLVSISGRFFTAADSFAVSNMFLTKCDNKFIL